jgi:hypothetical protein
MLHIYKISPPPEKNGEKLTTAYKSRPVFVTVFYVFEFFLGMGNVAFLL